MSESQPATVHPRSAYLSVPRSIWVLGLVSLFMDMSSELIHSLLPVFMVSVLGASLLAVGIIEGIAESTALLTKIFSGALSDYWAKRKVLVVIGYGAAALTKPLFPLASSLSYVFAARFLDRVGKGIRGAPRDALIGELAPVAMRGRCYGLRQSLDTIGAFVGPLLAMLFMALLAEDIRMVLWIAVVPAVIAVILLLVGVEEPSSAQPKDRPKMMVRLQDLKNFGWAYWWIVLVGGALTLARFSEAFLVLRAQHEGMSVTFVPLVLVIMNIAYAISAYPAGILADRLDRRLLLAVGVAVLILADATIAFAGDLVMIMGGILLWGLHMGLTQGLLATLIADAIPSEFRGTAFGVFHFASGLLLLAASVLAGFLWDQWGPSAPFLAGAGLAVFSLLGILWGKHHII